jgi:hypothetical protein
VECSKFCRWHGGGRDRQRRKRGHVEIGKLPSFYRHKLNPSLAQLVEQQLDMSPTEQFSLNEELAMARTMAMRAIEMYSKADEMVDESKRHHALGLTGDVMKDALLFVKEIAESAHKLATSSKDKFSIHNLQAVVNQITKIAHDVMKDHPEMAEAFEASIAEHVKLPDTEGTTLLPDETVTMMDATIPRGPTT